MCVGFLRNMHAAPSKFYLPIRNIAKADLNNLVFRSFLYIDESELPTQVSEQRSKSKGFYVGEWIETLIVRGPWRVMSLTSAGEGRQFGRRYSAVGVHPKRSRTHEVAKATEKMAILW